jgi:hypothetical protein
MDNEFWINVELLSFGGNIELMVVPHKKYFEVYLDEQELCKVCKDKDENWEDIAGNLDWYSVEIIGNAISLYYLEQENFYRQAG